MPDEVQATSYFAASARISSFFTKSIDHPFARIFVRYIIGDETKVRQVRLFVFLGNCHSEKMDIFNISAIDRIIFVMLMTLYKECAGNPRF